MTRVEYQVIIPFGSLEKAKDVAEGLPYMHRLQKVTWEWETARIRTEVTREDVK